MRLLAAALLLPLPAAAFEIAVPIDCDAEGCFIQQYVDHDPGSGAQDFTCGPLVYDGHKGTDFALPSLAAMEAGVEIRAVAPGTVVGGRDTMPDIAAGSPGAPDANGQECGNGVRIDHGGGWITQYCHMKKGSVRVRPGEKVTMQTVLGEVGLSGQTQFPHVHLQVEHEGRIVDPFSPETPNTCGEATDETLFTEAPEYRPGGLIAAGFSDAVPAYDAVKEGGAAVETLARDDSLVIWGYLFGGREGDMLRLEIDGPDGEVFVNETPLEKTQAQLFRAGGRRSPEGGWAAGRYSGTVTLLRGGTEIDRTSAEITVD